MYKAFQRELILLNIINNLPNIREFILMFSVKLTVKTLIIIIVACLHFPVVLFKFQCLLLLSGFTALHSAVFKNNIQIVTYLVSLGADVNAQVSSLFILIKEYSLHTWIFFLTLSFDSLTSAIRAVQMASCCLQRGWHDTESFDLIIILGWYCPMLSKNIQHSRHCWGKTSLSGWSDSIKHFIGMHICIIRPFLVCP